MAIDVLTTTIARFIFMVKVMIATLSPNQNYYQMKIIVIEVKYQNTLVIRNENC